MVRYIKIKDPSQAKAEYNVRPNRGRLEFFFFILKNPANVMKKPKVKINNPSNMYKNQ